MVEGSGFRVWGFEFRVEGKRFRAWDLKIGVKSYGLRV
jgi:hypothetical protein